MEFDHTRAARWWTGRWPVSPGTLRRTAVVLGLLLLTCCSVPQADARSQRLGSGPSLDGYPWADQWNPVALDPWGFVQRQCTSFAAWYLNSHGVSFANRTRGAGGEGVFLNAGDWDDGARAAGFQVGSTPTVGSIAQWGPDEVSPPAPPARLRAKHDLPYPLLTLTAGRYGHVAVVSAVLSDGSVLLAQYDGGDRRFRLLHTRAPRYLRIGTPKAPGYR